MKLSWELVLDQELLEVQSKSHPEPIYNPEAIFALVYTSGTTGHPKGVAVSHASILANIDHLNYWMPYRESSVHLHAAPIFHIIDFPFMRDPDGYFYILDRLKDMIVTGGNQAAHSQARRGLEQIGCVRSSRVTRDYTHHHDAIS